MRIDFLTLFPEMFAPIQTSLIKRATDANKIQINVLNIRDFSKDKHKKCDDYPYGGGAGLVMTPQPIADAIMSIEGYEKAHKIFMTPTGKTFSQEKVVELAKKEHLIILCGHYEGVDQRIIDLFIDEEISIGDFVLTGGEIPAMAVADAVLRYVDGVIGSSESLKEESFSTPMLEYDQYTRPQEFMGKVVPQVLVNGDHKKVDDWRRANALEKTRQRRPDLLK